VTGVVLPLAVSTFKLATPGSWLVAAMFLAHLYGVPRAPTQLLVIALTGILTSFSVPGVPHRPSGQHCPPGLGESAPVPREAPHSSFRGVDEIEVPEGRIVAK
jgi:hypothetical protein